MSNTDRSVWLTAEQHEGYIPTCLPSTHEPWSVFMRAWGPPRSSANQPVVINEAGAGSTSMSWIPCAKIIAKFARVYCCDRPGFLLSYPGHNDAPQLPRSPVPLEPPKQPEEPHTLTNRARQLHETLRVANIEPPYVLVGHSLGGTLIRAFLAEYGSEIVVGMVMVDALCQLTELSSVWPVIFSAAGNYAEAVGLAGKVAFSDEEWKEYQRHDKAIEGLAEAEIELAAENYKGISRKLDHGYVMGNGRLSVIEGGISRDLKNLRDRAVELSTIDGKVMSKELKAAVDEADAQVLPDVSERLEKNMRLHLALSNDARYVKAEGDAKTHNLQLLPSGATLIADEVRWVMKL